jgi:hypothetical protein
MTLPTRPKLSLWAARLPAEACPVATETDINGPSHLNPAHKLLMSLDGCASDRPTVAGLSAQEGLGAL